MTIWTLGKRRGHHQEVMNGKDVVCTAMLEDSPLIAAAPALLEACKMAYRSARVVHGGDSEICVRLENAIALAEGGDK